MKRLAVLTWLAILSGWIANAQPNILNTYTATCDTTPSAATTACTIQQPASGAKTVEFVEAFISTAAATDITFTCNGTAASGTAVTPAVNNPGVASAATATAWHTSDAGSGTACGPTIPLSAGAAPTLNIADYQLRGNGTTKNFTIRASSMTGRIVIVVKWREY
jgi:hypothetical protein